jgi:acyl-CoA dehydrogenase
MDLALTPELVEIQQRSRRFLDEHLLPVELQCELEGGLPPEVLARISEGVIAARLHAVNMPRAWGGQGYTWLEQVICQEQLGRSTNALWDVVWRPANVLRHCNDEQRERYLLPEIQGRRRYAYAVTEPGAGSDASRLQTHARRTRGGWRIDGEKWFVTAADVADYLIVVADAEGHGPTAFLIDQGTPGLRETRRPRYMHTFVYEHPEYVLEGCEVPDAQVLGGLGKGHELSREWFIEERLMIAARCLGGAQRALEVALEYACEREQFGQRIVDFQGVSFPLASSAVELAASRALVYQVAWEASRGLDPKSLHAKASAIKLHASEMAGRVADRALQVLGGRGYMRENPVERLYRDLRVDRIWEGTSEIQRVVVANELVKRGAATITGWPVS